MKKVIIGLILINIFFLVSCQNIETCDNNSKDPDCKCFADRPYKRILIPDECIKQDVNIKTNSFESKQCINDKNCVALDLLRYDIEKCGTDLEYRCWREPIFT
jgi:hypothetical protein